MAIADVMKVMAQHGRSLEDQMNAVILLAYTTSLAVVQAWAYVLP